MISETTYDELKQIAARYPQARSGLLPMLHLVQSAEGQVTADGIRACAEILDLTPAEVSGVATFYTQYKRHPNGEYTVGVCTNTLCAIMGGDQIWEAVSEHLGVGHDETTPDGKITLERVGADAHGVLAVGVALVLRVEGRDAGDLGGGEVEDLGAEVDAAARDVAVHALHEVQQRQERGALLRVAGHDLLGVSVQLREHVRGIRLLALRGHAQVSRRGLVTEFCGHYRSTPPMTGSSEATATMTSATWPPSHIAAVACRLLNEGSRKCAR